MPTPKDIQYGAGGQGRTSGAELQWLGGRAREEGRLASSSSSSSVSDSKSDDDKPMYKEVCNNDGGNMVTSHYSNGCVD